MNDTAISDRVRKGTTVGAGSTTLVNHLLHSIEKRKPADVPYRHWTLTEVLPPDAGSAILDLPFAPACVDDTQGKRETHNSLRVFFCAENRRRFAVCEALAAAFQSSSLVHSLEQAFHIKLGGSFLRIEYCQDTSGFWLEPHRDVTVKLLTMQVYLSRGPDSENLGTDIYRDEQTWYAAAPSAYNSGLVFVPGDDTWHGFRRRPFQGVRRSLIINYVTPDWISRHELADPDRPVS